MTARHHDAAMNRSETWRAIHAERRRLVDDLTDLPDHRWRTTSLCGDWTVEQVVAHLTAGALETRWRWIRSVVAARFDFDLHNRRRLGEHLGSTPAETLRNFDRARISTSAPSGHHWAWLGEIVVHGEDIRRPLGIVNLTPPEVSREIARHFVAKDFTVQSKTHATGLRLRATDIQFEQGDGPEVAGPALSLLMALAGRSGHLVDLDGPGIERLDEAISSG